MHELIKLSNMASKMLEVLAPDPEAAVNERARIWRATWARIGLDWPPDWEALSLDEKTRRLDEMQDFLDTDTQARDDEPKCAELVRDRCAAVLADMRELMDAPGGWTNDLGRWQEYALCYDFHAGGTFSDIDEDFHCLQISWGGPAEEFRLFVRPDAPELDPYRIEFWYLEQSDGAHVKLETGGANWLDVLRFIEGGGYSIQAEA